MSTFGIFQSYSGAHDINDPNHWFAGGFGGRKTTSGEFVSPTRALTLPTYFACIRVVSEDVSSLPLKTYRRLKPRGKEAFMDHPAASLLHEQANPEMTAQAWRETIIAHAMGWHGGYTEIEWKNNGDPVALWPIHPSRVTVKRDENGVLYYEVRVDPSVAKSVGGLFSNVVNLAAKDVIHIHGIGDDGITGWPLPTVGGEAIGTALALQKWRAAFFGNNASPGGYIKHPGKLSPEAKITLRESWDKLHSGAGNAYSTAVFAEGMEWHQISVDPVKAQALEAAEYSVEEICRICRVSPHKVGHHKRSTFNNVEQLSIDHVNDALQPWITRWEQEIKRKLFAGTANRDVFAEHLITARLRGDQKTRSEYYTKMQSWGNLSINDVREMENQNPVEGGETYFVPMNMQTLEKANKEPEPVPEQLAVPPVPKAEPDDNGEEEQDRADAAQSLLTRSLQRLVVKEANAMRRLAKKHANGARAFIPAATEFYVKHAFDVADELGSLFEVMERFRVVVDETSKDYAGLHCQISLAQVCNAMKSGGAEAVVAVCDDWIETRAGNAARGLVLKGTSNE